ncbi:class I SAM-dependent methyltransferase [Pseudogracilibacillus sp. SE30717A]|uniref:class I SAM-dependent methyltransferase n=1 Tax=Pseudogracilibacillus sp. SE30717A TaxID=3098293 RepID=UPI00300E2C1B
MVSDHYYSEHPQSESITETKQVKLNNHTFTFTTSSGVFSKKGIDFGTKLLIESFRAPDISGDVLDLGCGYGPIGISVAFQYKNRDILMVDINERAVSLAEENIIQNKITNALAKQSNGFENVKRKSFAAIITNPPIRAGKKVIYTFFEDSLDFLKEKGELWIVIQKKQGAPSAITFLSSLFSNVEVVEKEKGYYIIRAIK